MNATRRSGGTAKRRTIREALERAPGFISAGQLHHEIVERGTPMGLSTVYRQLHALADAGIADTISDASGQLFRACSRPGAHHHHLVCVYCGRAADVDPPDEQWIRVAAARHGFIVHRHELEIFGRCDDCAPAEGVAIVDSP